MKSTIRKNLEALYLEYFDSVPEKFEKLPISGSDRLYFRLSGKNKTVIGTYNEDVKENLAFLEYSKGLKNSGISVPEIYATDETCTLYLQEDLGDKTLFSFLSESGNGEEMPEQVVEKYKKVLQVLPVIQIKGAENIDFSFAYPRQAFDKQSMLWDLNYFKYYFLKLARIPFDEEALENDFHAFSDYLLKTNCNFFLYRDFQSRNIMINNDEISFIDYQGGRKGALQYDLASLLYDSKANVPQKVRDELVEYYLDQLEKIIPVDRKEFKQYYYGYVLIRIMQAMGAYGFRGFYEKKSHFLKSVPYALDNLSKILQIIDFPVEFLEMMKVLKAITLSESLRELGKEEHHLTVRITSFSYKKGIPSDPSGNGGGFVFDCRAIHNPGRYDKYKDLTGKDEPVIQFFKVKSEMDLYLESIFKLVDASVNKYLERGFTHLSVNFGCTGGQHRSVFAAEALALHLQNIFPVKLVLTHREQGNI